jgi:hypothetical protein
MESKKNNVEEKKDQAKKPYSSPKLTCYGKVVDLTQGSSRRTKETTRRNT